MKTLTLILTLTIANLTLLMGKEEKAKTSGNYQISTEEMEMLYDIAGINSVENMDNEYMIKVFNDKGEIVAEAKCFYGEAISNTELKGLVHRMDFVTEIDNVAWYRVN